jgi:hypothetical protein
LFPGTMMRKANNDQQLHRHDRFLWLEAYLSIGLGRAMHDSGRTNFQCAGIAFAGWFRPCQVSSVAIALRTDGRSDMRRL